MEPRETPLVGFWDRPQGELRFVRPPAALLATIAGLALTYLLVVQAVKTWFYRRHALL